MILITLSYVCNLKGNKYLGNVKGCGEERTGRNGSYAGNMERGLALF